MSSKLERFFRPHGIAIFGASEDFGKINGRPLKYLLDRGYEGRIYPINPKYQTLAGLPCYADVRAIPGVVDLAIVAVPAEAVFGAVEACIEKGVGGAVIFSSGFGEMDDRGRQRERELTALARRGGMPFCGPNSVGFWNAYEGVLATFSQAGEGSVTGGPVAFVTQSGAFGTAIVALLRERNVSLGYFVNSGNEADLTFSDLLEYVIRDDRVRVVAGYIEGLKDGPKLLAVAAEALALGKPLVVAKVGTSAAGARAAASHTGSLAGSDRVYSGVFRQKGIVRVADEEELLDCVAAFTMCALPRGPRVALVTHSGGAGVLMADKAEAAGLETASLTEATRAALQGVVPAFGSIANPIDITAQFIAEPRLLRATLDIVLADPNVDIGVFYLGLMDKFADTIIEQFRAVSAATEKPLLIAWAAAPATARAKMSELGICAFPTATRAVAAAGALVRYARRRESALSSPPAPETVTAQGATAPIPEAPEFATPSARTFALLQQYGIDVAPWAVVANATDAVAAARDMGYPVAIKVESADIQHKSDAHALVLGVANDAEVRRAYDAVLSAARAYDARARIDGVRVQKMIEGGEEVIVGVQRDPVFGPVVMAGLGGIFVEVLADVSFRASPLTLADAHDMLRELRGFAVLSGVRGRAAADVDALAHMLVNVSHLAADHASTIAELDLNPVKVLPHGAIVVDALAIKRSVA
ncbi:MAG: acetate--CoA ligase family protein [Vulcanimicrobiaceae bacterium]